jgi:hypothetical protein
MRDETKTLLPPVAHPSSLVLHPSSFILHPSSFILHPSSFILHPSSFIPRIGDLLTGPSREYRLENPEARPFWLAITFRRIAA